MNIYRLAFAASLCLLIAGCGKTGDPVPDDPNPDNPDPDIEETPVSDERIKEILVELYDATDGPNWNIQPNWAADRTIPLPLWDGVLFIPYGEGEASFGLGIELPCYGLSGEIPSSIFDINTLVALRLDGNFLTGQIPDAIGNDKALVEVNLNGNELTGNLPSSLSGLKHLTSFSVRSNKLSGKVPDEVVAMPYFYTFELGQSDGYGLEYPQAVEDLHEKAAFKSFYETLPEDVKKLCPWDGESPLSSTDFAVLDGQGHIVALELAGDESGQEVVLNDGFLELSHLRYLVLHRMAVKSLPENFSRLSSLEYLLMYMTQLETFPEALMSMKNLRNLLLYYNMIDSVPDGIEGMTGLRSLGLYGCRLSGSISKNISKLRLKYLEIGGASADGEELPVRKFSDFTAIVPSTLKYLMLDYMHLEGELPEQLPSLLPEICYLSLSCNSISGNIPASYAKIPDLFMFDLYMNKMSGDLPQEILDSPLFRYWNLAMQQEGYGFTNLPPDSAEVEPEAMDRMSGGRVRSAEDVRADVLRQAAIECGGAKFLDRLPL